MKSLQSYRISLNPKFSKLNKVIRFHWKIENNPYCTLYLTFKEDRAHRKKDNFPVNFIIINEIALILIDREKSYKASENLKRAKAELEDNYRELLVSSSDNLRLDDCVPK